MTVPRPRIQLLALLLPLVGVTLTLGDARRPARPSSPRARVVRSIRASFSLYDAHHGEADGLQFEPERADRTVRTKSESADTTPVAQVSCKEFHVPQFDNVEIITLPTSAPSLAVAYSVSRGRAPPSFLG